MTPKYDWALDYFGGRDAGRDFSSYSNIIFSNGELDPWQAGGILENFSSNPSIEVLYIKNSAHHLDLRLPDPADPAEVTAARAVELSTIQKWLNEYNKEVFG